MDVYKRSITVKLWTLRIAFVVGLLAGSYLIDHSHTDYGIVLFFLLLCGAIFPVTNLKVGIKQFQIRQYYIYGIFRRSWKFSKTDNVRFELMDMVISDAGVVHADDWYDAFWTAVPAKEITINKYVLKYYNSWARPKQIKLTLSQKEINVLKESFFMNNIPEVHT